MTDDVDERHELSERLHDLLVEDREMTDFLDNLARLSAAHVAGDDKVLCGIVVSRAKHNTVVASSSDEAQKMDEVQAGFDEGPCLEAQRTDTVVLVPDIRTEERWPEYMNVVRDHGLRSVIAVPLELDGLAFAAMNFYTRRPEPLDDHHVTVARRYAELAAKATLVMLRLSGHSARARDLQAAMESRTAIDVAVGIVMAQNGCSQAEAFEILQRASSHQNSKLRDLAEQIVARTGGAVATTAFDP